MKKFALFILAICVVTYIGVSAKIIEVPNATGGIILMGGSTLTTTTVVAPCTDCTGDPCTFVWHMEVLTDVTTGTPSGCSDADTTPTDSGATRSNTVAQDGTYSLYSAASGESVWLTPTTIVNYTDTGTISTYIYMDDWSTTTGHAVNQFSLMANDDNTIYPLNTWDGTYTDFTLRVEMGNDGLTASLLNQDTSGLNGNWVRYVISWDLNATPTEDKLFLWIDMNLDGNCDAGEYAEASSDAIGTPAAVTYYLYIGDEHLGSTTSDPFYLDNFYITNGYTDHTNY